MALPRWLVRTAGIAVTAIVMAFGISWAMGRGYVYDALDFRLRSNPHYYVNSALMRQRAKSEFDMLVIGNPDFVTRVDSQLESCVSRLTVPIPTYRYDQLKKTFQSLHRIVYKYILIENHPAFWTKSRFGRPLKQRLDAWNRYHNPTDHAGVRDDVRSAFTMTADAFERQPKKIRNYGYAYRDRFYKNLNFYDDINSRDNSRIIERIVERQNHENMYWFMNPKLGPTETNLELKEELEKRFMQGHLNETFGHSHSIDDVEDQATKLSLSICTSKA